VTTNQAFYRKWRPTRFSDVAGQQHVAQTLKRAISSDRVTHAYLFTGPRGVGKTSTARIFAKALNGPLDDQGEPIPDSDVAVAIDQGNYLDLIEMDAASNRGIDNIRDLIEKIQFQPSEGQYKVYIIDEVHMLTDAAFNALLKTLEEPPPHAVLILATTDAHKLPATIVSRCQRFDFKRLSNDEVIDRLIEVCEAEMIETEPEVLEMIARIAWGSLRDAENLLEQLFISYGRIGSEDDQSEITVDQARDLLGLGDTASSTELATALLNKDASEALAVINRESQQGNDIRALREGTVDALRVALLVKAGVEESLSQGSEFSETMQNLMRSSRVSLNQILHILTSLGQADLKANSSSPLPLEMAVLQATTRPAAVAAATAAAPASSGAAPVRPQTAPTSTPAAAEPEPEQTPAPSRDKTPAEVQWEKVVWHTRRTKNRKFVIGSLLRNVEAPTPTDGKISLRFKSNTMKNHFMEEMQDKRSREALKEAITSTYGTELDLEVRSPHEPDSDSEGDSANGNGNGSTGTSAAQESAMVRSALAMGARLVSEEPKEPAGE